MAAGALPVTVAGHEACGMSFAGGMGYRDNDTNGIATGAQPESIYMVTSGTHFNSQCCFDFGNVETSGRDTGNGHTDAIYFGSMCWFVWPICYGRGPWVQADMENGLFFSDTGGSKNRADTGNPNPFVTAMQANVVAAGYRVAPSAPAAEGPAIRLTPDQQAAIHLVLVCPGGCSLNGNLSLPRETATRLGLLRRSLLTLHRAIDRSRSVILRLPAGTVRRAQRAHLSRLGVAATVTAHAPGAASTTRTALLVVGL